VGWPSQTLVCLSSMRASCQVREEKLRLQRQTQVAVEQLQHLAYSGDALGGRARPPLPQVAPRKASCQAKNGSRAAPRFAMHGWRPLWNAASSLCTRALCCARAPVAEADRMHLVLFGMQSRTLSPYLAAVHSWSSLSHAE
jgi:hypothetical protein